MTALDQLHAQMAYVNLLDVLRDVEKIKDKDCMLINVQLTLYRLEDVLQNYIGPLRRDLDVRKPVSDFEQRQCE